MQKALEEKQRQRGKEEKEMNDVIQIYQETKHRIDCMKKERIKEVSMDLCLLITYVKLGKHYFNITET